MDFSFWINETNLYDLQEASIQNMISTPKKDIPVLNLVSSRFDKSYFKILQNSYQEPLVFTQNFETKQ